MGWFSREACPGWGNRRGWPVRRVAGHHRGAPGNSLPHVTARVPWPCRVAPSALGKLASLRLPPSPLIAEVPADSELCRHNFWPHLAAHVECKSVSADSPFLQRLKAFSFLARGSNLGEKKQKHNQQLRKAIYLKYTFSTIVSDFKKAAC